MTKLFTLPGAQQHRYVGADEFDPRREADWLSSVAELQRAIPRTQALGTRMLRGMSFMMIKNCPPDDPQIERLVRICEEAGIVYVHENCMA